MDKKNSSIDEIFALALENHQRNKFKIAENLYKKALKINPNHLESIFLLGTLSIQTKNLDKAKVLLNKAIQIKPNYTEAYYNLGIVYQELGEHEKTITYYKKAIKSQPNYKQAYNNLGTVFKSLKEFQKAVSCYEKAIQIDPNYTVAHYNLAATFKSLEEFQKAVSCYEKAIQINPNDVEAQNNLGSIFIELGEFQKAINCYKKAIQVQPENAETHNNLGVLYKSLGDLQKSIHCYENAFKYQSENLNYLYVLSNLKKEILDIKLKNKIKKIMNNSPVKSNLAYGNFLLSKYELESKNYDKEFDYLLKGHQYYFESEKEKFKRDVEYCLNILPKIGETININKYDENNKKINHIKPIFIIGVPRCGSTLVEKIIGSGYKDIPMGEETGIFNKLVKQKINKKQSLNSDIEDLQIKIFESYKRKGLVQEKHDYIFTDKTLDNFFYIDLIKKIFTKAIIINCKRNPFSSIMSILKNNLVDISWAHNLEHIFKYFDIYFEKIKKIKKNYPNFIYELQFEEFVNNPEIESKRLMRFCKLPWNKKCLDFYKRKDLISHTTSNMQIRNAIYKDSINKYLPYRIFLDKYGKKYSWFN